MSKIEVNTVDAQCGSTVTIGSSGKTIAVPGNIVKSNALQASDAGNIISQSGTTITLGASGDTVALATGASQTGFGSAGPVVDWQTDSIKTGDFTATSGEGYFVNTTAGSVTCTLPASPSAGDYCGFIDYARTWDTNYCYLGRNSSKIQGTTEDWVGYENGQQVTLIYVDGTQGWLPISENLQSSNNVNPYVVATGGCVTTTGNYKIHTFTGPGTFTVTKLATSAPNSDADYVVVAGGGGGGVGDPGSSSNKEGGGGAGGYRESPGTATCYTASPKGAAPAAAITLDEGDYPITVGSGGAGGASAGAGGSAGSNSIFSTITAAGGGESEQPGGSGGGGDFPGGGGGSGNTPPTNPTQGNDGGPNHAPYNSGKGGSGGGGATAAGSPNSNHNGGSGGAGATSCITGSPVARAGGGGGSSNNYGGSGGTGGGGAGKGGTPQGPPYVGVDGTANTGGGGGSGSNTAGPAQAGSGGSGVVIIRYKYQ